MNFAEAGSLFYSSKQIVTTDIRLKYDKLGKVLQSKELLLS